MELNNKPFRSRNYVIEPPFLFLLFRLIPLLMLFTYCNTTEPEGKPSIVLEAEEASCSEVWLKVEVRNVVLPAKLKLFMNDTLKQTITLNGIDSVIYDTGLEPGRRYRYYAEVERAGQIVEIKSEVEEITTLETTSHDYNWESYTFGGENGSSILYDVAIINENDIWAVGEIHTAETDRFDSNGVWVQPYNAVHWDGQKWELRRIMFKTFCNQSHTAPYPINAVLAFPDGEVAMANNASQITFVENGIQDIIQCLPVSVNSIWGSSSDYLYLVGNNGNIAHYNGTSWEKVESGTELSFVDVWGSYNKRTESYEVLTVAIDYNSDAKAIAKINEDEISFLSTEGYGNTRTKTIWFIPERLYLAAGANIYKKNNLNDPEWKQVSMGNFYIHKIRGQGLNDIVAVGTWGEVLHYNGKSWKSYVNELGTFYGRYKSVDIKNNLVVIAGVDNSKAKILIGRR